MADEIDDLVTNLPNSWVRGMTPLIPLPETASAEQLVHDAFRVWLVDNGHTTNYTVLKSRQVAIPRAYFPGAYTDSYTATLVETSHGKKAVLAKYEGDGWWSRVYPVPADFSGVPDNGDEIYNWLYRPNRRDPKRRLVFVEVLSITNENHTYTEASNSKVSDDDGKTWYNLLNVWSGIATLKVIESPEAEMPATITVPFVRHHYVHTHDETWTDWVVKPGAKLLAFFAQKDGEWSFQGSFFDPTNYLSNPNCAGRLQALFKTPLSSEKAVADRNRLYDEASKRARQQAAGNHVDEK